VQEFLQEKVIEQSDDLNEVWISYANTCRDSDVVFE
jgi:hypothetical protein